MKILMVCLGNICRSPMAQGILERKISEKKLDWQVDSAGTSGWHDGAPPDTRAIFAARRKGTDISRQISRKISLQDITNFDVILAMDSSNYGDILQLCKDQNQKEKVHLVRNFESPGRNTAVPDPYYDGRFDEVYDILDKSLDKFVETMLYKVEL
ncbi:MAG: low molecular weight phosphotyrosine protein phosphatase [Saprospiraceae bacterium]|jgi:protein-tyrosine phosphatase|nr:low molecular weight phosphotyrosine protein phosphatase [Saprospiraceae bacterium]